MRNAKDGKKYSEDAAHKMRLAARLIDDAMTWKMTSQGYEYWNEVNENLRKNADEALEDNAHDHHARVTAALHK